MEAGDGAMMEEGRIRPDEGDETTPRRVQNEEFQQERSGEIPSLHQHVREKWVRAVHIVEEDIEEEEYQERRKRDRSFLEKVKLECEALSVCVDRTEEHAEFRSKRSEIREEWREIMDELEVLKAFGWNPYTRRYTRPHWTKPTKTTAATTEEDDEDNAPASIWETLRHTHFWMWRLRSEQYIIAISYLLGGVMFIWGSMTSLFDSINNSTPLYSGLVVTPYLVGGIFFFTGTAAMFYASYQEINKRDEVCMQNHHT